MQHSGGRGAGTPTALPNTQTRKARSGFTARRRGVRPAWKTQPDRCRRAAAADNWTPASKATEDGDTVRFERPGPFGVYKWQKKKSDLDETEKAALRERAANNNDGFQTGLIMRLVRSIFG